MSELNLTEEEKADLIGEVTELAKRNVLKKTHYVSILGVCQAACEERIEEIDKEIGKPSDIIQ